MVKLLLVLLFVSHIFAQPPPPIPDPFNAIPPAWGVPLSKTSTSDNVRSEYRALTGEGNNIANPLWGTDLAAYIRTQGPVNYVAGTMDGIDPSLPTPRLVSNRMVEVAGKHAPNDLLINQLHLDWGHFITADLMNTYMPYPLRIPGMFEKLPIPADDLWYDFSWGEGDPAIAQCVMEPVQGKCKKTGSDSWMYMPKYWPYPGTGQGTTKPKECWGDTSQWLDLSQIYGNPLRPQKFFNIFPGNPWFTVDEATGQLLDWGKFKLGADVGYDVSGLIIPGYPSSGKWEAAGDFRHNKTPGLRSYSRLFMLEHNRLVDEFRAAHPNWNNETLFHEARRMNIAFYQAISVREYLAAAVGQPLPPYTGYNASVNPGLDPVFTTVTLRYGHSALPALIPLLDNNLNYCPFGAIPAVQVFIPNDWEIPVSDSDPYVDPATGASLPKPRTYLDYDAVIRGLAGSAANKVDLAFIDDIRNLLAQAGGPRGGEDLISYDIYHARDAGVADYNTVREALGLPRKNSFKEITSNLAISGMLERLYGGDINKLDAYVGALAEEHTDTEMGEFLRTSFLEQMGRIRDGDRFWFESLDQFTPKEIELVHSTKLKDIILRNYKGIDVNSLPVNTFFLNERQLTAFKPEKQMPEPLEHPDGLPWETRALTPVFILSWAIDRSKSPQQFTVQLQVQTDGWAGIGFKPEQNGTMKGADIVLCRIPEVGDVDGENPECRDSKALDVGIPLLDTDIGGTNSVELLHLSRTDGILTAMFRRPMTAADEFDNEITDDTRIIFAFNPLTNRLKYHGPTRNPDVIIDFQSDYLGPPVRIPIDEGVTIFLYVICGIGACLSIFYMLIVLMKKEYFKFQTPEFCLLVSFGSLLGFISVLLLLPDSQNDATCKAHLWFFGMSFWLMFLGFFIKVARVYYIVKRTEKTMEVTVLPFWKMLIPLIVFMLCEMVFNICWDTLIPPDLEREDIYEDNTYIMYCGGNRYMWLGSVVARAIFLGVGVWLAIQTKHMPQELNWSKEIAMSIYTMAIILIIGIPLGFALTGSATMVVLLKGILTAVACICVTGIIHFDSLRRIFGGKNPRDVTRTSHSAKTTKGSSSVA